MSDESKPKVVILDDEDTDLEDDRIDIARETVVRETVVREPVTREPLADSYADTRTEATFSRERADTVSRDKPEVVVVEEDERTLARRRSETIDLADRDPAQIQADIDRTREAISRDIDAISEKLSPERLKERAESSIHSVQQSVMNSVHEVADGITNKMSEAREGVVNRLKQQSMPISLIGAGLGLIAKLSGGRQDRDERDPYHLQGQQLELYNQYGHPYREPYNESYDRAANTELTIDANGFAARKAPYMDKDTMRNYGSNDYSSYGSYGSDYRAEAQNLRQRASYEGRRASRGLSHMLEEHPLVVGAVALMVGAAIGLSLPSTRYENRMMGDARDHLLDDAKEAARDAKDSALRAAQRAKDSAQEEFSRQGFSAQGVKDNLKEAVDRTREAAERTAQDASEAVRDETKRNTI